MKVLIACERSCVVRNAFLERGHDAYSCDLQAGALEPHHRHLRQDVLEVLDRYPWDLLIGHPECTYLTLAGAKHLYNRGPVEINGKVQMQPRKEFGRYEPRWRDMQESAAFYNRLLHSRIPRICLENPIMHGHAAALVGGKPTQYVQPWMFGHAETKKTGYRLVNLPPLVPTDIIPPDFEKYPPGKGNGYNPKVWLASPGPNRKNERSETLPGLANAMATQWGSLPV